jgi:hypothetical protein
MIALQQAPRVILTRILWMTLATAALLIWVPQRVVVSAPLPATVETYTIRGTVHDHDGTPLQNILVSTGWLDAEIAYATSDDQGNYTLALTTPGVYRIQVNHFYSKLDPPAQTVTVPPSQTDTDFTFPTRHTIRGTIKDADGMAVEGATVATDYTDPMYVSTVTDAKRYSLRDGAQLSPGSNHSRSRA